ncbi:MAG: cytochrome P450 [Anaerolineales bacterium]|nr:cytochrome P450 [Anaerolineales bacterium]
MSNSHPRIQHIADHLVDQVAARGHMDVVEEFALPLAIEVIADLLGIDASNHQRVRAWSRMLVSPSASSERNTQKTQRLRQVMEDFVTYLTHLCAERRRRPRPDLISALIMAEEAGDQLSQDELFSMVLLILIVGHETSVHLISNCVLNLAERPALAAILRESPEQIPAAVEELIRFDGPVERATMRFVAKDMRWHGATLRRGDGVSLILASAHRDPGCCPAPDVLDITRTGVKHLGFGLGPHYCLGAPLARIEAQIAINTLLQKLPGISLALPRAQLRWHSNPILHGVKQLPICWPDR